MLIIKPHSIVDIVTNSSSELFVCDTDKSLEIVKEILVELLAVYNKGTDNNLVYGQVFQEPKFFDIDVQKTMLDYNINFDRPNYWDFYKKEAGEDLYDEDLYEIALKKWQHSKQVQEHFQKHQGYIAIYSNSGNSIPHVLFDFIEESFNCKRRVHLG